MLCIRSDKNEKKITSGVIHIGQSFTRENVTLQRPRTTSLTTLWNSRRTRPYAFAKIKETRAPRGIDRSPEYNKHCSYKLDSRFKNLTTQWNQKQQHFITLASRSLLWIRFIAVAFRSEEFFWRRGHPCDLFCLALDPPLGKYGKNIFMHVPGHEHFIPTRFRKHPLSVKAGYVFSYNSTCIRASLLFI